MKPRVLVVEDNPANLSLMEYLLRAFGYDVLTAADGEEGVEVAGREVPDLILINLQLPRVTGVEAAHRLKADPGLRHIPIIAVTAFAMVGDRERILGEGFDGYIAKPITPETFVPQVEGFIPSAGRGAGPPASGAAPAQPAARSTGRTILVVDNSPVNLQLLRSTLEPFGYAVLTAGTAREAIQIAQERAPDLILSDVHMPGQNGYDLIRIVKADDRLRAIPFVFISSTVWGDQECERGLGLGARRFILRPIEPQALIAEIEACFADDGHHSRR